MLNLACRLHAHSRLKLDGLMSRNSSPPADQHFFEVSKIPRIISPSTCTHIWTRTAGQSISPPTQSPSNPPVTHLFSSYDLSISGTQYSCTTDNVALLGQLTTYLKSVNMQGPLRGLVVSSHQRPSFQLSTLLFQTLSTSGSVRDWRGKQRRLYLKVQERARLRRFRP